MGLLEKFCIRIGEKDKELLHLLDVSQITKEEHSLLRKGKIYELEQLDKIVRFIGQINQQEADAHATKALKECRVDDFIFFVKRCSTHVPSDEELQSVYNLLASRGRVQSIEDIFRLTKKPPVLNPDKVIAGYNRTIGEARLEATDYLRQLSGIPIVYNESAVQRGYSTALYEQRISALKKLHIATKVKPLVTEIEITSAIEQAEQERDFSSIADIVAVTGFSYIPNASEIGTTVATLVTNKEYGALTSLCQLFPLAAEFVSEQDLGDMTSADCLKFIYSQQKFALLQQKMAEKAYVVAVETYDINMLYTVYKSTQKLLPNADYTLMCEQSMLDNNLSGVLFLSEYNVHPDESVIQAFLEKNPDLRKWNHFSGTKYDSLLGSFCLAITEANMIIASRILNQHEEYIAARIPWASTVAKLLEQYHAK